MIECILENCYKEYFVTSELFREYDLIKKITWHDYCFIYLAVVVMNISLFEIISFFWIAAMLWIGVEYFIYRHSKHQKRRAMIDAYRHE